MTRHLPAVLLCAALVLVAGCGGEGQDADEAAGAFRVEVAEASFPARQSIAQPATMRIAVRNPGEETLPDVAVTVETKGKRGGDGPAAFAQASGDARLADRERPVWVLDRGPRGGDSAYANTWSLGPLRGGATAEFEWKLTAVEAGSYSVAYRASPGLDGKARLADGSRARGTFRVTITDEPVPARVNGKGEVERGEGPGAGED